MNVVALLFNTEKETEKIGINNRMCEPKRRRRKMKKRRASHREEERNKARKKREEVSRPGIMRPLRVGEPKAITPASYHSINQSVQTSVQISFSQLVTVDHTPYSNMQKYMHGPTNTQSKQADTAVAGRRGACLLPLSPTD